MLGAAGLLLAWPSPVAAAPPADAPLRCISARPLASLTDAFPHHSGWTGGDVAGTIPLGPDKTLWTFGDTWIGRVENGRRVDPVMVNNTFAWQSIAAPESGSSNHTARVPALRFFWKAGEHGPAEVLRPEQPDSWYWPADGVVHDGALYLFCKQVRKRAAGVPGFQFDWFANVLLRIANPAAAPTEWQVAGRWTLPGGDKLPRFGSACLVADDYLYVYGLFPEHECHGLDQPMAVARVPLSQLADETRQWETWSRTEHGPGWSADFTHPREIFGDGAAEMSVGRVDGIPGYVATYTSLGLGREIIVRHALQPEGPWSTRLVAYESPREEIGSTLVYGAKAHHELATRPGQLIVTYCRNPASLSEHARRPNDYYPRAVEINLESRK